jgi:hypothetical protein
VSCYHRSLALFREVGERYYEADTLGHLADAHEAAGDLVAARRALRQALVILDELRHQDAGRTRTRLTLLESKSER